MGIEPKTALSVDTALAALAEAHGPAALAYAYAKLKTAVRRQRREQQISSVLGATIDAAVRLRLQMREDGASEQELAAGLEQTVRASWPFTREWKYLCHNCDDTGGEWRACPGDATCGRDAPHRPHDFVKPCWCSLGRRFREKTKPTDGDDFTESTKGKHRPTRFGHRS